MERATVHVNGVVQSVGFRPFVYRTAVDLDLRGTVRNRGDAGVLVELEGTDEDIDAFLKALREDDPPLARVETVEVERKPDDDLTFQTFEIVESEGGEGGGGTIPPDTAMCDACVADMCDPDSRYHDYWATSCVDCGPRFTVIESLPYDRPATSMAAFPMCDDCREEYEDPVDRRYHAQTIACPQCGPTLAYLTSDESSNEVSESSPTEVSESSSVEVGESSSSEGPPSSSGRADEERDPSSDEGRDPFPDALTRRADGRGAVREAATTLADGGIVVVKGIGGAHLACDATDDDAVARLRERTGRPEKPFALMAPDVEAVEAIATVSDAERESLTSPRRPILLLDQRDFGQRENWGGDGDRDRDGDGQRGDPEVSSAVAPGLHTVGVMLPYSGVHHLLFDDLDAPLVLTSANLPGQPMLTANGTIAAGLREVADGFLLHDRRIVARCDDSVARVVDGERRLVRRSRGFAPTPVPVPDADAGGNSDAAVLGLGPELDVTAGLLADGECYLTQYVGDVDDVETFEYLTDALDHLRSITGLDRPPVVAHDLHPEFRTTERARRLEAEGVVTERVAVQHHHAHAASVLAERGRDAAIAVTVDGVGYGPDGTVWGGEVLDATRADYQRVAGLAPMAMPGGDRATRYPGRMLAGALYARHDAEAVRDLLERHEVTLPGGDEERDLVCQQLDAGVNTPETTSAGRFLDAVSALLGVCDERTYEGEPAIKLEALAAQGSARSVDLPFGTAGDRRVLDAPALLDHLVALVEDGTPRADVAATAQQALADGLAELAVEAADERNRDAVALSGGVAYNEQIASRIRERVEAADLAFLGNERVPPGDGGIAYGQAVVAAAREGGVK